MRKSPLQFSLAALLLTVAVVAGDLALMLRVRPDIAVLILACVIVGLTALAITGLVGTPGLRSFCIGALVPLALLLYCVAQSWDLIAIRFASFVSQPSWTIGQGRTVLDDGTLSKLFGAGILLSIALGYLCVGFCWLIDTREPPDATPVKLPLLA